MSLPRLLQRQTHILVFTFREERVFVWADICAGCYKQPRYIFTGRKSSKAAVFCGARWLVAGGGWSRRLSQCEERAVIDCYTPMVMLPGRTTVLLEEGPSEGSYTRRRPLLGPFPD